MRFSSVTVFIQETPGCEAGKIYSWGASCSHPCSVEIFWGRPCPSRRLNLVRPCRSLLRVRTSVRPFIPHTSTNPSVKKCLLSNNDMLGTPGEVRGIGGGVFGACCPALEYSLLTLSHTLLSVRGHAVRDGVCLRVSIRELPDLLLLLLWLRQSPGHDDQRVLYA